MKNFGKNKLEIPDHQEVHGYSTRQLAKWGVYLLRGSFDNINKKFWQKKGQNFRSPKKIVNYNTKKLEFYLLYASFDLESGPFWPCRPTGSIDKVLTNVQSMDYSTLKLAKLGVYPLRGSFYLENGTFWPLPKGPWNIAHKNRQNGRFTCFGGRLTFKMGHFCREGQSAP
ncbi:hypothetical protein H5410_044038 [Solanum commersonii]|uniref:Uncharacterized protein n=1 Tax=Solanum commersonii TaxID=4109 RepID=A0A9J5Y2J9_SOLCO|nr:hypothetical protein H5410_044038 [Solanum commersonii]